MENKGIKIGSEKKRILLIFLLAVFFWIILVQMLDIRCGKGLGIIGEDGYTNLLFAKRWAQGHPYQFNIGDKPSTAAPDYLYPLILSIGWLIGFRTNELFIFWAYILNLLLLLGSLYFIYKFFSEYLGKSTGIITAFFTLISPAIFNNFWMVCDFSLYFFFFFGALAYIKRFPLFAVFTILTGLSRPEGLLPVSILIAVQIFRTGFIKKKIPIYILIYILVSPQYIFNLILSSTLLPQGVVPQGLWHYSDLLGTVVTGFSTMIDQIKSTLLSYYPTTQHTGLFWGALYSGIPPLFFIFFIIGLCILKDRWKENLTFIVYIVLLFLGDAFTIFSGVHLNRHIAPAYPLILGIGIYGILNIKIKNWRLTNLFIPFFTGFLLLEFIIGMGKYIKLTEDSVAVKDVCKWIDSNLPEGAKILALGGGDVRYWIGDNKKVIPLSPAMNTKIFIETHFYKRDVEMSEFIKKNADIHYLYGKEGDFNQDIWQWVNQFSNKVLYKTPFLVIKNAEIVHIDLFPLCKKYNPEKMPPFAELNIGEGISEKKFYYKGFSAPHRYRVDGFLQKGKIDGREYWEGGRLIDGYEEFLLSAPADKAIKVVMLTGNKLSGNAHFLFQKKKVDITLPEIHLRFWVNNNFVGEKTIKIPENFEKINFIIPKNLNNGRLKIRVEGNFISFHYWFYLK